MTSHSYRCTAKSDEQIRYSRSKVQNEKGMKTLYSSYTQPQISLFMTKLTLA